MSVFDLFRGFFGVPGGHYRGDGQREPFFDGMTQEEDDEDEDPGFRYDDWERSGEELLDEPFRFGFSFGPSGMRIHEPPVFGQVLREMEEIFDSLGRFGRGFPSIEGSPREGEEGNRRREGSGNSLRDFMLKNPDDSPHSPPSIAPRDENSSPQAPSVPRSPFHHWSPFSSFKDIWSNEPRQRDEEKKEDGDLDSQVSSGGLEQILTPEPSQPKTRSFFQSVTVTKVVKPDGTVEERRTVRDGQGNEKTTVTRSGGPGVQEGPQDQSGPPMSGGPQPFSDMQDEFSMFSKFFGGFRG